MNRLLIPEGQIADFDLLTYREIEERFDTDYLLYFLIDGSVDFISDGKHHHLKENDFLFIDSCAQYSWKAQESILMVRFVLNVEEISKYYEIHKLKISCDSETYGDSLAYQTIRHLLNNCMKYYYGKKEKDGRSLVCLNSIYYQLVEQLVENFSKYKEEGSKNFDTERVNDIVRYINANFRNQISLNDLAERMYLSPTYVSRYIKKKLGKNLMEYLTDIRLESAVGELETTEKTIVRIALDNGFPNVTSFNKAFKEHYGQTPTQYQENIAAGKLHPKKEEQIAPGTDLKIKNYIASINESPSCFDEIHTDFRVDATSVHYISKNWNRLINIGRVSMLLRSDIQEHVIYLKKKLGFEYTRIWDLYDEELSLNINQKKRPNFSKLDKAFDFLIKNQMKPYIELGFKPVYLRESFSTYLIYKEREILFKDPLDYGRFLEAMLTHFVNRYGLYEVSQWTFEQWVDPRLIIDGEPLQYFRTFEVAWNVIKNIVPDAKVGGCFDRENGTISFESLIRKWSKRNIQPDFISLYCYHARANEATKEWDSFLVENAQKADFFKQYIKAHKKLMQSIGMQMPLYVSEYNLTPINRNILNDSCFKGAYIMKVIMDMYTEVEMMGYWFGSDLLTQGENAPHLLEGGCGLLSYDGIRKPAFYAIDFMNRLGNYLLGQRENIMISFDGYEKYVIVCHNYKHVGSQYFMNEETSFSVDTMQSLFPDLSKLKMNVEIRNVKNGRYYVKTHSVNSKHGSVQDEWNRMGYIEEPSLQDISYLASISIPHISIYEIQVTNNILEITLELEPQEIQYIEIQKWV